MRRLLLHCLAGFALATPAAGQWAPARAGALASFQSGAAQQPAASVGRTLLWATGGAILGGIAGGVSGASVASREDVCQVGDPDGCLGATLPRALWGTGIGITIGTPVGAHFGNRRQGRLAYTALTSAALFAGELVALNALVDDGRTEHKNTVVGIAVAVPILQILATTAVERAFTK